MPFFSFTHLFKEKSILGVLEGLLLALLLTGLVYSYLPIGFKASLVNFTYGERGLDPDFKLKLPVIFLMVFVGTYFVEMIARRFLLRKIMQHFPQKKAFLIHLALLNLIIIPFVATTYQKEGMGFIPQVLYENMFQMVITYVLLRSGSLIAATLCHSLINFVRFVFINDIISPFETLYFYSSASEDLYWVSLAVLFLAFALMVAWTQKWGIREQS